MLQHVMSKMMKEDVQRLQRHKKHSVAVYAGPNRRLSTLLPPPQNADDEYKVQARHLMQREFMLGLGANERTCCLLISSQWRRSRASVLVLRGKVVGCIYTRKDLECPVFGEEAYSLTLAELGEVDTQVSSYELDEAIVIASAAIFSKHTVAEQATELGSPIIEYKKFLDVDASGCIFVNDRDNQTICRIYVVKGLIVGIYVNGLGWIENDINLVEEMVELDPKLSCESFMMEVEDIFAVYDDTFPLSAEGRALVIFDRSIRKTEPKVNLFESYMSAAKTQTSLLADKRSMVDEQQTRIDQVTGFANRVAAIKHAHSVDPLV